jgi:hypothetical protein
VDVEDGLGGQLGFAARGGAVWLANVLVLQPGEEGDQLRPGDGREGRIARKVELQFFEAAAIIDDRVWTFVGRGFAAESSRRGCRKGLDQTSRVPKQATREVSSRGERI